MRRTFLIAACCVLVAGAVSAGKWDIDIDLDVDPTSYRFLNPCSDPIQLIEIVEGNHHIQLKAAKVLDEGGLLEAYDINLHQNHQGLKGIGYDLVVDDEGTPIKEGGEYVKAKDEDGNFITTEYSIPGTYNVNQKINVNQDGEINRHGTFMCNMISHGSAPNAKYHWNEIMKIDGDGNVTMDREHYWCRCAGGGPEVNGEVDCGEWPEECVQQPF